MIIDVLWDDLNIFSIEKINGLYISKLYKENINEVRKSGFPLFFLKEISLVSDELPPVVRQRISNINNIKGKLKFKNDVEDIESNIFSYINTTECKRPTDKFSIKIQID